jgi:hypothetical protein
MSIPLKNRSVGELLSLTFKLGFQNFIKLFLIALIFQLPILILKLMAPGSIQPVDIQTFQALTYGAVFLSLFLSPLQQASMMQVVADAYTEGKTSLAHCLGIGLKRFIPLLVYSLLLTLILATGMLLLVIPFFFFFVVFSVGAPALVIEGLGPIEALKRSADLTRGYRWMVLFFFIVLYVLFMLITFVFGMVLVMGTSTALIPTGGIVMEWAVEVLASLFLLVGPVVLYFQLRTQKEGLDLQGLSDLVDRIGQKHSRSKIRSKRLTTPPDSRPHRSHPEDAGPQDS